MITLNKKALIFSILLLAVLVYIALYIPNGFIRASLGDFLVVIFIYYAVKAFIDIASYKLITGVVLFAYCVEVAQYFNIVSLLGAQNNQVVSVVVGNTFDWLDMLMYTLGGIFLALITDKKLR